MAVPSAPIATTTPEMAALLTKVVSRIVISTLRTGRFYLPPEATLFETYPKPGHEDTYVFGSYEDIVIDPAALASYVLAEGVTPTATAFGSDVNEFSTVEYARLVTVTSEQIRKNPAPGGFMSVVADKVSNAALDLIDAVARTIWAGYSSAGVPIILPGATPANTNPIDTKAVLKAVATLQTIGVQTLDGQHYGGMASPAVLATLMAEAGSQGWTDAVKYAGPERLLTGEVGEYRGVRWFANPRIPATGGIYPSFIFGKEALAFADVSSLRVTSVQPTPSISDPLAQRGASGFAVRCGGMLVSDLSADTVTRRHRFVVLESKSDTAVTPADAE